MKVCRKCLFEQKEYLEYLEKVDFLIDQMEEEQRIDAERYKERINICSNCNYKVEEICTACGCFIKIRAAKKQKNCPYQKW